MAKPGKTGLTLRDSTYQYAKDRKDEYNDEQPYRKRITWDDIVVAGMQDIEEEGVVQNPVTTHDEKKRGISIDDDVYDDIVERKESFRLEVTWDDIIVHGADRGIADRESEEQPTASTTDGLSDEAKEEVREIVAEMIDERLTETEDNDFISEDHCREIVSQMLQEEVVHR